VLKEWKTTGKALQGQVHRLTLQRNQEMLKQQKVQLELDGAHKQLARAGLKVEGFPTSRSLCSPRSTPSSWLSTPCRRRIR